AISFNVGSCSVPGTAWYRSNGIQPSGDFPENLVTAASGTCGSPDAPEGEPCMVEFDFGLGDDVEMLRQTLRGFTRDHIEPRAAEIDRSNRFPRDLWPKLGELGLLGITVEEEFGGSGLGYL